MHLVSTNQDMTDNSSLYKSLAGFEAVMTWYETSLKGVPVPCESWMVNTSYGKTHVIAAGQRDAQPMVLLHGTNANALTWKP